jgi:SAM-dependent methyltransferase
VTPGAAPRHPRSVYEDRLEQLLASGACWLDLGCGRHRGVPSRPGVGLDSDVTALGAQPSSVVRVAATASRLPFADETIDVVSSHMVFEHLPAPAPVLDEIQRVLRPGGRLLAHTPNAFDLVTLGARVVPNRWHGWLVSRLEKRRPEEVYPTYFRLNRRGCIRRALARAGFTTVRCDLLEHPEQFGAVPLLAAFERGWHRLAHWVPLLRGTVLIEAVRR